MEKVCLSSEMTKEEVIVESFTNLEVDWIQTGLDIKDFSPLASRASTIQNLLARTDSLLAQKLSEK